MCKTYGQDSTTGSSVQLVSKGEDIKRISSGLDQRPTAQRPSALRSKPDGLLVAGKLVGQGSLLQSLSMDYNVGSALKNVISQGVAGAMQHFNDEMVLLSVHEKTGDLSHGNGAARRQKHAPLENKNKWHAERIFTAIDNLDARALRAVLNDTVQPRYMPDIEDGNGVTPLGRTLQLGDLAYPLSNLLIQAKAMPLKVDSKGNSAFHYAGIYGCTKLAKDLLASGSSDGQAGPRDFLAGARWIKSLNEYNRNAQTALDLAYMHSTEDWDLVLGVRKTSAIIELLKNKGAKTGRELEHERQEESKLEQQRKEFEEQQALSKLEEASVKTENEKAARHSLKLVEDALV